MTERSRGLPEAELFMSRPSDGCDSPTVEPLRIFKPQSPKPSAGGEGSERFRYPPPPSSATSFPSAGSSSAAAQPVSRPSFPLPPGASSSANPLPYPVDDEQIIPQSSRINRLPYPDDRPQLNTNTSYNDTSPRINLSPSGEKKPRLAERRGAVPTSLSPTSPTDADGLFAKPISQVAQQKPAPASYPTKSYYPPPGGASSSATGASSSAAAGINPYRPENDTDTLKMPVELGGSGVNRFSSTASTSTTRASRGSPPPPETPIVEPGNIPGGGIEARYAAAGISGTATLNSLQAPSAAAAQRLAQYGAQSQAQQSSAQRPWTPTESPENQPHGPPTVYQGVSAVQNPPSAAAANASALPTHPALAGGAASAGAASSTNLQVSVLEQDFQRMQASTPPPAYTSVNPNAPASYPKEKQQAGAAAAASVPAAAAQAHGPSQAAGAHPAQTFAQPPTTAVNAAAVAAGAAAAAAGLAEASNKPTPVTTAVPTMNGNEKVSPNGMNPLASPAAHNAGHPAFANDTRPESMISNGQPGLSHTASVQGPASPPPLPEGWISHLDQNSGQYYYIHLATQATQWEFPKGPTPLHHDATPLSPATSTYGNPIASPFMKQSMASPMYPPTPGYAESITSMATTTASGFMGPPPSAGVDMYKIAPTNGVYFGPYLRYVNMDVEKGIWLGSIMIVTDAPQPPTIHIHLSVDLSPNPRQLMPYSIYTHQRWSFYKYDIDLPMGEGGTERWTYAVTSHLGCTRYEFVVAGRHEQGWRFLAHSGNDFSPLTSQAERNKLGGVDFMWKDVLQKNVECGGFHVQLGLGDQIYADRLWREVPLLQQWLAISGRENRKNVQWTARHEEDVTHAYFHYYTSHFDQPFLREAFAQIPHILQVNDHDMYVFP